MKKLATVSLVIFLVIVTAVMTAGLVFYQNRKDTQVNNSNTNSVVTNTIKNITSSGKSLTLDMKEVAKHNKQTDCWMVISGKVYDITSFFGSHPGGNGTMVSSCGKDATDAYMTKDPNATSSSSRSAHSSRAKGMLANYFVGDLNATLNAK